MDACARIRGVPLKSCATMKKETIREGSNPCLKSLLKHKKELCNVVVELHNKEPQCLSEVHYVWLPSHVEGEDFTLQTLTSLSTEMMELLRSLHVHTLKDEEILLLKDPKRPFERKDSVSQACSRVLCILRHNPNPQISVCSLLGLLARYTAGIRYALELQVLKRGTSEACQAEDDDTNQSVSSIEEDFVTAFEHLEEEDTGAHSQRNQRDVASQTVPSHSRDLSGSRIIISSIQRKSLPKEKAASKVSETVLKSTPWPASSESSYALSSLPKGRATSTSLTESDESDCSSPSPIIFLDEVGYQKSLKAKLHIPKIPVLKNGVEDSDSEVSEFFDSFDQFDELDRSFDSNIKVLKEQPLPGQTEKHVGNSGCKFVSRGCSTTAMNPHKFDHRTLPANVKKPTPLKPGSPYSIHSDSPDSPWPVRTPCEESGPLFSPVCSSAFSPLGEGGSLEYFWKADEDGSELRKPQDLCSLYKTYSDFANNLSKEILGSVCGYSSPVDFNINKNLSCVCHKEFKNTNGHLMKLSDIQETVTITKSQSQSLKDGIQKFATDLVEMSLGSAFKDLQKGVSSCTTTLCHLAARLTSSVFQMAFHEIGMRHAYVLKERAVNGLASFLVGEAISGALTEFLFVKKQIFNNTVTRFAADLAEELVFEGIMEVCQFSHPSTPLTPSDWSFEQEEEVVSSYASDLSESVLQEAFIELSQSDVTFTTQAAISVSLDNICYVSAEDSSLITKTCSAQTSYLGYQSAVEAADQEQDGCTVKKALYCVSGMASCVPVPIAGKVLAHVHNTDEPSPYKSSIGHVCQTIPKRTICCQGEVASSTSDTSEETQTESSPGPARIQGVSDEEVIGNPSVEHDSGKPSIGKTFQNFSGNMVDTIVGEAFDLMHSSTKVKKKVEDCADFLSKSIAARISTPSHGSGNSHDVSTERGLSQIPFHLMSKGSCDPSSRSVRPVSRLTKEIRSAVRMDTLEVPTFEVALCGGRKVGADDFSSSNSGTKSSEIPSTPPSSPQQPSDGYSEKQIRQFSKKLKGTLAKEFSPATPPSTPYYPPAGDTKEEGSVSDKADFMLKLIRSLSEEAVSNEDQEEDQEDGPHSRNCEAELSPNFRNKMIERSALHYAERLACHIVSMATEMDTLNFGDVKKPVGDESKDSVALHSAQFSEQTLNSLWTYAGEVAGEVINDVKKMMSSSHCRHKIIKRGSVNSAEKRQSGDGLLGNLTCQWPGDVQVSGTSSWMSSEYPSCESVSDEYAGYLIKVLKKEGGNRELILDQYATRLAYRSIKSGLAHAARKMKQRSPLRLHSSRRLHNDRNPDVSQIPISKSSHAALTDGKDGFSCESLPCSCQDGQDLSSNEYVELVNFAESLAYNITCDVTRKLRMSSVRLPKSLTDSCLYRKSTMEDMPENLIKNTFSCSLLPCTETNRLYRSTSSLNDGKNNNGVMQVIEHYARKIVDDTLEITLGPACVQAAGDRRALDRNSFTEKLAEAYEACRYCQGRDCLFCCRDGPHGFQGVKIRRQQESDAVTGLEIPRIHIDLEKRAAFAEEMVSSGIEKAKKELSCTSLNADSGIGHDGASFAESLTTEIMTSALSNACPTVSLGTSRREGVNVTESTVSQQLSLSVGDDSLGSWSNLSFEEDHPDESSSFHHLSDSNGNSSSWSSLGLEGEVYEEHLSFSPSDSDGTEEKEAEAKEDSGGAVRVEREHGLAERALLVVSTDVQGRAVDPQMTAVLQWIAASIADLSLMQLSQFSARELQQLPAVAQRLREREFRVGDLLQALLRYLEERRSEEELGDTRNGQKSLFQWLLEKV
ncbi:A-kinase anchor protein 11 isoform X1 [Carassius gibelio]|uniref:A-kinase anchor protein 11 isoform X1 n=1 Tax=Carassius gibelio TaxID=101364 RepID=UPI002279E029|nr:A-kinase anchor protein 11 isoform X1 [Carassius gibelio]XP_052461488.1 A-kinase anchor protein 11 isoform X1 [Carassius gibelio]